MQITEVEVDIPDGMTPEQAQAMLAQEPILKVLWESPDGTDVEVPRGMNLADMIEAGLIAPLDEEAEEARESTLRRTAAATGAAQGHENQPFSTSLSSLPPRGVFDPSAVKGAEERSPQVSDLYAKVMANKAKARAQQEAGKGMVTDEAYASSAMSGGAARALDKGVPAAVAVAAELRRGHVQNEGKRNTSWFEDIFRLRGGKPAKDEAAPSNASSHDKGALQAEGGGYEEGRIHVAREGGVARLEETNQDASGEEQEEMVGYDFILQHRDDKEGKVAAGARASMR